MEFTERFLRTTLQTIAAVLLLSSWLVPTYTIAAEELPIGNTAIQETQDELVTEIRIVGNNTISTAQVSNHLGTRVGRPFDRSLVQRDVRRLANLGWFVDVRPLYEKTPKGRVVIFEVVERPTIRYVTYLGNEEVADKKLAKETGLKEGGAVDPYAVEEGRRKILEYYQGRGYNNVQVTILEGTSATDKGISYLINEGRSQKVWNVEFEGNNFVSSARLKTIVDSKPPTMLILKGYVDREKIDKDVDQLTAYYRSFGFFQAKVSRKIDYYPGNNWVQITFVIHEGPRYQVRNVKFLGNTKFEPQALAEATELKEGEPFEQSKMRSDAQWIQELYGSHGYVFADIRPETVFLEEPGAVDLIYHIKEGEQFRVGRVIVQIDGDNPHTRIQTVLNRLTLRPGDIMDIRELQASERRLMASSLFHSEPAAGVRPKLTYRIPEDADLGLAGGGSRRDSGNRVSRAPQGSGIRGQSPDRFGPHVLPPPGFTNERKQPSVPLEVHGLSQAPQQNSSSNPKTSSDPQPNPSDEQKQSSNKQDVIRGQSPEPTGNAWWVRPSRQQAPTHSQQNAYQSVRGQSPGGEHVNSAYAILPRANDNNSYGGSIPAATDPSNKPPSTGGPIRQSQYSESIPPPAGGYGPTPGFSANPVPGYQLFPDGRFGLPGQPYPEQTVDIIFQGQETQTGRLMLGMGVNSDAGLVGNIVLDERNFDWRRVPRSMEDIRNGTAFRGAGQKFRIDASPGSEVNRYLASFQEPYLLDTPISLGLSGSFFDRRFRDWDEERLGGRISLGYQWVAHDLSATLSYRGESIDILRISNPAQPDLAEAAGDNSLHGFRLTVINDTRDSTFLPTQGHYLELTGEQVIGTFDYPRVTADYRRYFLLRERPDHSGRHVVSAATNIGYTGTQTPIYEHFFAGGFSTLRGFDFRGASPVDMNVEVGGEFQWISSLQYLFPITADDMLHGVAFCDFGTVEPDVEINDFRVAPGLGLRVTVPAMGPAPIALDFAWPVAQADTDDEQVFSFSMGFSR